LQPLAKTPGAVQKKGVSGRTSKEGRRAVGPSEGEGLRKAAMRSESGVPQSSGLHLVTACDAHNRQLVSRRRILKYSMYTMIQALELRANRRARGCAGHWSGTPGVSDFAKYRAPRTHRERHARAHERASKTVQPTFLPPRSGICARGKETCTHGVSVAVRRPSRAR
jgi:hypothetical protein